MSFRPLVLICPLALLAVACDDDDAPPDSADAVAMQGPEADGGVPDPPCVPTLDPWDTFIRPRIEVWCGECHGEPPQFGAPYGLLDYDALVDGAIGERRVDQLVRALRAGTMPPPAQPQPPGADRAALLEWATCGANAGAPDDEPVPGGFDVDRPLLDAPDVPPVDTDFFELRADAFAVAPGERDRYECFTFAAPVDEPRLIRRVETIVDDTRVLHHTVLIPGGEGREAGESGPCQNDNALDLIYAWAPGQGPLHFPEGGIRVEPGERLTLQIHYNNAAGHADVADSSGVRIHHGPVTPDAPIYDMLAFGPLGFSVPARSVGQVTGYCVLPQDTTVFASFPHMHEAGVAFEQTIERADGAIEPFIDLQGWSFDSQYLYSTPIELRAGDLVTTTCTYRNLGDGTLRSGTATSDEMCFNFAYVTPPLAGRYCNRSEVHEPAPYTPGQCAPVEAVDFEPPRISGAFVQGEPPPMSGGRWPAGERLELSELTLVLTDFDLGFAVVDPDASQVSGMGQVWVEADRLVLDAMLEFYLTDGLLAFDDVVSLSVGGVVGEVDEVAGVAQFTGECGDLAGSTVDLEYAGDADGGLSVVVRSDRGLDLAIVLRFTPATD